MGLSFGTDLTGKVAVVTGAGGVLCGMFAKTLAEAGAKVAVLDLNEEAAGRVAEDIVAAGHTAKAYKANVLERESLEEVQAATIRRHRRRRNTLRWATSRRIPYPSST